MVETNKSKKRRAGLYRCTFCGGTREYFEEEELTVCEACKNEEANWVIVDEF